MVKYNVGDKVWIRKDLILDKSEMDYGRIYSIRSGEKDIRGLLVTITSIEEEDEDLIVYNCKNYYSFTNRMIDEVKTNNLEPEYEIY